jgi:hypothetical protein
LHFVPKNFGNRLQTPTLIGCMFLKIPNKTSILSISAAISEALNYDSFYKDLSIFRVFTNLFALQPD